MEFRNDAERNRYVLEHDGHVVALADYQDRDGHLVFTHTEVEPAYEGQGLASQLVRQALDDVRARGRTIVPACSFVRGYVERHPEYADLVARDAGRRA